MKLSLALSFCSFVIVSLASAQDATPATTPAMSPTYEGEDNYRDDYPPKSFSYQYGDDEDASKPRNLIIMIPDGTSPQVFTMARSVLDPTMKTNLHIDPLLRGTVKTYSASSLITDSAASGTAYSAGYKTYNAAISVDNFEQPVGTVLEAAKARGMVTGMIVTSRVTHATPGCFAAHVADRNDEDEIARQYVANGKLDFMLGGGERHFPDDLQQNLTANGYTIVKNIGELNAYHDAHVDDGNLALYGLFAKSHMSYDVDRVRMMENNEDGATGDDRQPSLPEMTETILSILKNNKQAQEYGYFIMIEGSRIDHAGHANDAGPMAMEAIKFDETVGLVKDHMADEPNTAMVSVADHGTGGLSIGNIAPYEWFPRTLAMQTMTSEAMGDRLENVFEGDNCGSDKNESCKSALLEKSRDLLIQYTNITSFEEGETDKLEASIAEAVDVSGDLADVLIQVARIASAEGYIGWTTTGHVAGDVNLYCLGPMLFERECQGSMENVNVNKIMVSYLDLHHEQDMETLKLRNYTTLGGFSF